MGWNPLKSAFNHVKKFTKKSVSYVKKYATDPMTWLTGGANVQLDLLDKSMAKKMRHHIRIFSLKIITLLF